MADNAESEVLGQVTKELKKIETSVNETHSQLAEAVERQNSEIKQMGGTSAGTRQDLDTLEKRYDQEYADLKGLMDSLGDNYKELKEAFAKNEAEKAEGKWKGASAPERKSLEEILDASKEFKDFNPKTQKESDKIYLGKVSEIREQKDITSGGSDLDSVFGRTLWNNTIFGLPFNDNMRLRDYMTVQGADGYSVHYVERTNYDNNADFQTAPGALKPKSNWDFVEREAKADVLAHWTAITNQQARQTPIVVNYIQNELLEGLYHEETRQILFADGTAPGDFTGIFNHDRVQTYNEAVAGETMIDTLRRSENQLGDYYLVGDLYVLNHRDWTEIELMKDDEKRYIWVSVQDGGTARMWRKPVLTTRAMPRGQFINGAFRSCARLLEFEKAAVQMFGQHDDLAMRNMTAIRAEEYIGLAVTCPQGFVIGGFDGSGSGS